jgi:hypothetical protein
VVKITVDHILWDCKETEIKQLQMKINKEIWNGETATIRERNRTLQRNISNKVSTSGEMDKNDSTTKKKKEEKHT